jgi:hypothetical protein
LLRPTYSFAKLGGRDFDKIVTRSFSKELHQRQYVLQLDLWH